MTEGLILGIITWLSLIFSFQHLPKFIKRFLLRHTLFCDILATGLCFVFLASISKSILSVVGSITCGLLVNFTLIIYKKFFVAAQDSKTQKPKQTI